MGEIQIRYRDDYTVPDGFVHADGTATGLL